MTMDLFPPYVEGQAFAEGMKVTLDGSGHVGYLLVHLGETASLVRRLWGSLQQMELIPVATSELRPYMYLMPEPESDDEYGGA